MVLGVGGVGIYTEACLGRRMAEVIPISWESKVMGQGRAVALRSPGRRPLSTIWWVRAAALGMCGVRGD